MTVRLIRGMCREQIGKDRSNNNGNYHSPNIHDGINAGRYCGNGSTLTRYYYLKDHLGSIKMMVDASGNVQSYNDYYPYGMTMPGRSGVNGAPIRGLGLLVWERDDETGYNATGPRFMIQG